MRHGRRLMVTHKEVRDVEYYRFTSRDKLFLDANIWLLFFGPQRPSDHLVNVYSRAFASILKAQSTIYIDVLIVSEFINTYARQKWQLVAPEVERFKEFRSSFEFQQIAQDIASDVRRVLHHCLPIESGLESLNFSGLLVEFAKGKADFNDQVIRELCKNKGLTLITNDGDFRGQDIPILTANRRLLV
ncbi:MAG: PIN domain-containing protein [Caldilineaceae bacterium SB0664_bin_27]|uniref:PIN domain-containing protein n=1 Tax=Caldilineaceae bacterium SB0664_bin_27 TaxID=2605260 RepID=A0A6B0YRJ8_9CHLR|nr:PIN domain-containing protein [Caldilineaceae bacterium SB0664_bin_27]